MNRGHSRSFTQHSKIVPGHAAARPVTRQDTPTLRWISRIGLIVVVIAAISHTSSALGEEIDQPPPAQQPSPVQQEPVSQPPPPVPQPPPPPPSAPIAQPPPAEPPTPAQQPPSVARDHRVGVRGGLNTRGSVKDRIGLSLNAEMMSPYSERLDAGLGIEFQLLQSQRESSVLSFMPIYWVVRLRPLLRYPAPYVTARLGFDFLGQEGDDTLAERNYYAIGIGLIRHPERAKSLQLELLYSRDQGSFPGIGISAGFLF